MLLRGKPHRQWQQLNRPQCFAAMASAHSIHTYIHMHHHTKTGIYTGDVVGGDSCLFVTERHTFNDLVEGLSAPCTCGMARNPWNVESTTQVYTCKMDVYFVKFTCVFLIERSCAASGVYLLSMPAQENLVKFSCVRKSLSCEPEVCLNYIVHFYYTFCYLYRLVHSFTCAGMLPVQYSKFSQFAELGVLGTSYISRSMLLLSY